MAADDQRMSVWCTRNGPSNPYEQAATLDARHSGQRLRRRSPLTGSSDGGRASPDQRRTLRSGGIERTDRAINFWLVFLEVTISVGSISGHLRIGIAGSLTLAQAIRSRLSVWAVYV